MQAIGLPDTLEEFDADWFSRALRAGGHEVTVTAAELVDAIRTTCTKARFRLAYDRETDLPETMMLKGGFEPHSERMTEMYQWEARFYAEIAPEVPLNLPQRFYAGVDPTGWRAATLMEDLNRRNVHFCRAQEPFDFDHVRWRLDMLAALHAMTWNSPVLQPGGKWDWVMPRFSEFSDRYNAYYLEPERWQFYVDSPRGAAVSVELHDREWMRHALGRLAELAADEPFCLIHGDTHPGNLYVDADGTPGFLDPTVSTAPWWLEISYHIVASFDIANRRRWEGAALAHYLDALARCGGPRLDFDHAWLRYRQGIAYGFFIFIINETQFQTEATNTAYTARFGIAAVEHGTKDLLA